MMCLKILLAVILSAVPLLFHFFIKPRKESPQWKNLSTTISTHLPGLRRTLERAWNWIVHFYDSMKHSDNSRKFFTRILTLVICTYGYVDFSATLEAKNHVEKHILPEKNLTVIPYVDTNACIGEELMMSYRLATFTVFFLSLLMGSYKFSNGLLQIIHRNKKTISGFALCSIALMMVPGTFIIGEIFAILLMASYCYPEMVSSSDPKGRKPIPCEQPLKKVA